MLALALLAQEPASIPKFETSVNLVLVPVVVRDSRGRPVAGLTQDDFQLFDNRKPQTIASFSTVVRSAAAVSGTRPASAPSTDLESPATSVTLPAPDRYVVYLFDDLNIGFADLAALRTAAERHFQRGLPASDHAAVYTVTGRATQEFTSDPRLLTEAVLKLRSTLAQGHGVAQCPDMSFYLADLIRNKGDGLAKRAVVQHVIQCAHLGGPGAEALAQMITEAAVSRELMSGEQDTAVLLRTLHRVVRRLAGMPGQRLVVFASPGFFRMQTPSIRRGMSEVLDLAARLNVTVSALDAHGIDTLQADASGSQPKLWLQYKGFSMRANHEVLADLTEGTGGTFVRHNDDLNDALNRAASAPEFSYVLGFSPLALKTDGRLHSIKVRLSSRKGLSVEARNGYHALAGDPGGDAERADIDDAVFSPHAISDIPVVLHAGYSRPEVGDAKLMMSASIGAQLLHFRRLDGRQCDSLTVVAAVFDLDGGYITGTTKTVNLKLRDETLAQPDLKIDIPAEFEVQPGTYRVRLVVRETGSKAMSAQSAAVLVPPVTARP